MKFTFGSSVKGVAFAIALATSLLIGFEGKSNVPYFPVPGDVLTICYGDTHNVKPGMVLSDKQCLARLKAEVEKISFLIDKYVHVELSVYRRAALISFVYNVGETQFRKSTLVKKLNANDNSACSELKRWIYFKHKVLTGLKNRREIEYNYCIKDDSVWYKSGP